MNRLFRLAGQLASLRSPWISSVSAFEPGPRSISPRRQPAFESLEPRTMMSAGPVSLTPAFPRDADACPAIPADPPSKSSFVVMEASNPPLIHAAPRLPAPTGTVVRVGTVRQLQDAVRNAQSNSTILINPGTYQLTATLYLRDVNNVSLRGATGNRDDVILVGRGMSNSNYGNVGHGVLTARTEGILIADLTIRDVWFHAISFNAGTQSPHVYNVRLLDAGQQFIKSNPDGAGGGVNNGIVEYSVIEYTTTARSDYTNGVDVHAGRNWVIRHNVFRNIRSPEGERVAGAAVLMWRGSRDSITESNLFINVQRGVTYGLTNTPNEHSGGVIRNNFIYRGPDQSGDVGIALANSPCTQVLHNTVILSGTYSNAIEYRFTATTDAVIRNNLTDAAVRARNGATAEVAGNVTNAKAGWFVDAAAGNLRLSAAAEAAIDQALADPSVAVDYDGKPRPKGLKTDVGADEFGHGVSLYLPYKPLRTLGGAVMA